MNATGYYEFKESVNETLENYQKNIGALVAAIAAKDSCNEGKIAFFENLGSVKTSKILIYVVT